MLFNEFNLFKKICLLKFRWFQNRRSKWRKRERSSCKHPEKELYNAITQGGPLLLLKQQHSTSSDEGVNEPTNSPNSSPSAAAVDSVCNNEVEERKTSLKRKLQKDDGICSEEKKEPLRTVEKPVASPLRAMSLVQHDFPRYLQDHGNKNDDLKPDSINQTNNINQTSNDDDNNNNNNLLNIQMLSRLPFLDTACLYRRLTASSNTSSSPKSSTSSPTSSPPFFQHHQHHHHQSVKKPARINLDQKQHPQPQPQQQQQQQPLQHSNPVQIQTQDKNIINPLFFDLSAAAAAAVSQHTGLDLLSRALLTLRELQMASSAAKLDGIEINNHK